MPRKVDIPEQQENQIQYQRAAAPLAEIRLENLTFDWRILNIFFLIGEFSVRRENFRFFPTDVP